MLDFPLVSLHVIIAFGLLVFCTLWESVTHSPNTKPSQAQAPESESYRLPAKGTTAWEWNENPIALVLALRGLWTIICGLSTIHGGFIYFGTTINNKLVL
jgi:hypothetical protein